MIENVLEKIIKKKSEKIVHLKKTISQDSLKESISANGIFINFKDQVPLDQENLLDVDLLPM